MPKDEPQYANALSSADKNIRQSASNKPLYLVKCKDGEKTTDYYTYEVVKSEGYIDIVACNIKTKDTVTSWAEIENLSDKQKTELMSLSIPWSNVVYVRNMSYKAKK